MKEAKERLMNLLCSICGSETIMNGEYRLVHADHIHILEDIIDYISELEKSEEVENSSKAENYSNEDKIKQLLKKIYKGECENYIVTTPEETAINGNFIDLLTMVVCLIEDLAKKLEISKEELCKVLSF